jgi:hypothetical protein
MSDEQRQEIETLEADDDLVLLDALGVQQREGG